MHQMYLNPSDSYNAQVVIWCFESNGVSLGEYFYVPS